MSQHGSPELLGGGILLGNTYLLGQRISLGGMGEVFEATHARLPGRYAVKILRPELLGNREAFARFCREAEVMSELRHPNVVQIYDFNTTPEGRPYFVMEHLEGRDLEARLTQSGPMPLPAAVRVVDAVASALATAHSHGIVHRDLKPANIFLVAIDGQIDELVKVLDFGISKIRSAGTLLSSPTDMIGSPAYMSPEQARGAADEIDGRSDQFALGAITYRMLTGFDPFRGDDIASLLYQVVHEEAPRLARTLPAWWDTRALQAVLDRALAKDPAQRFSGMMELARAFEAASEQTLSHEMAERGTVNLGATLIAAPPPPPLRPARTAAAEAPAAGERTAERAGVRSAVEPSEIEDSAPPIRTPAARADGAPSRRSRRRRPRDRAAGSISASTTGRPCRMDRRPAARPAAPTGKSPTCATSCRSRIIGWRSPPSRCWRSPAFSASPASTVTSSRAGGARSGSPIRCRRRARHRPPVDTAPPVENPALARRPRRRRRRRRHPKRPAPGGAPRRAKPAPAEAPPERPSRQPSRQGRRPRSARRRRPIPIATTCRPSRASSTDRGASISPPRPRRRSTTSSTPSRRRPARASGAGARRRAAPSARPNPFAQPPSAPRRPAPPPPPPDTLQNQFSIPPPAPTEDSPSRDLVPPSEPEREPGPGRQSAAAAATRARRGPAPRRSAGGTTARGPADQPMAPSF